MNGAELKKALPPNFSHKVSDERLVELANRHLAGYSYNDFVKNFGEWFSMACELLAYRANDEEAA